MTQKSNEAISTLSDAQQAALFQELLRQMARDNVTLLWGNRNSLEGEQLVAYLQEALAARQATPKTPANQSDTGADTAVQAYQFEAIGFIDNREDFKRLEEDTEDADAVAQRLFAPLAAQFAAHGFTGLEAIHISEDDEQGDEEIKFFVCVRLLGHSDIEENETPPAELGDLMGQLGAAVCCVADGTWMLHPEDWELASIDDPEEQAN
jgi:hypothetical protein